MSTTRPEPLPRSEKIDRATAALALLQLLDAVVVLPDRRSEATRQPAAA